jgi:hypothetical protein
LRFLKRKKTMPPATRPSTARPPTTPPTIAPTGVLDPLSSSSGSGTAVVGNGRRLEVVEPLAPLVLELGSSWSPPVRVRLVVEVSRMESMSVWRRASQVSAPVWPEKVVSKTWKLVVVTESQEKKPMFMPGTE